MRNGGGCISSSGDGDLFFDLWPMHLTRHDLDDIHIARKKQKKVLPMFLA